MLTETTQEAAQGAEHAAEGGLSFNPGESIVGHILDHDSFEIMHGVGLPLPELPTIAGVDLSITKHISMMWIAGIVMAFIAWRALRNIKQDVPSGLRNALEVVILFIRDDVARKSIGPTADRYVPYLLSTFFFILLCNLLGLVPGMATATGNISVTAGLALMAFVVIQFAGLREYGVIQHFKNLIPHGLPAWMIPLMFALEILSMFIKPFALCVRLFANMMAGHVVILAFVTLIFILGDVFSPTAAWIASPVSVGFVLFVHFLELLVATVQAYIFTMLTATFIGMSAHPAH
ncbi:MAG: F0F1 ATP synthase subunit A [Acidobacteria bacterium]|nr:F0F1 ATP synthase subunit A [Acidobacteriota bacterium]NIM63687.1 F0F1 ATP synthase subunit A [Acidobacteriota bacterium]NIO59290.1 F0F1 ATP synthase subunit A [Acidobacteriota bacterium]NIQ30302.1 F0F1 ATP synthase subunit A [Acidobacteriota bacterium]NIQ85245.1 F0F1 ATP synthase subunit A [Acidobacteriota bacterium]